MNRKELKGFFISRSQPKMANISPIYH